MELKEGVVTPSGNFKLVKKMESIPELYELLIKEKSLFVRHRMYPTAVIRHWSIAMCEMHIRHRLFWKVEKLNNK